MICKDLSVASLAMALLLGCASARPSFERRFNPSFRSHDLWMTLLTTRYACDTVLMKARAPAQEPGVGLPMLSRGAPRLRVQSGMVPCDVAALVSPEIVRAWEAADGLREEWVIRRADGTTASVYLEGADPQRLRVVPPIPS